MRADLVVDVIDARGKFRPGKAQASQAAQEIGVDPGRYQLIHNGLAQGFCVGGEVILDQQMDGVEPGKVRRLVQWGEFRRIYGGRGIGAHAVGGPGPKGNQTAQEGG